ncbi:hypothetical protein [Methanobrevibacter sp.]|uniref:hypothetical protein n=1 Tax=Methanobrevibacter sp. TaxID=66852 RepID=UPI00388F9A50
MEKNHKIIIVGLIIVIIALIAGIAYMTMGNSSPSKGGGNAPDGMQIYDFNSEFKMSVPKNAKFLKEWNYTDPIWGSGYSYFDKDNEFAILYVDTPLITHEFANAMVDAMNKSGNGTFEVDGDLLICHNLKANGKVGDNLENTNFTERIVLQKGHQVVGVSGNDLDLIKSMANTIKFYE